VKLRVRGEFIIYMMVSVVLGWTVLTAIRVTMTTRYSLQRVLVEDGANKMLGVWGALEQNFQRREAAVRARFQRDPLWPVIVARTDRQSAAARATGNVNATAATAMKREAVASAHWHHHRRRCRALSPSSSIVKHARWCTTKAPTGSCAPAIASDRCS
jgi:hypothetical protein